MPSNFKSLLFFTASCSIITHFFSKIRQNRKNFQTFAFCIESVFSLQNVARYAGINLSSLHFRFDLHFSELEFSQGSKCVLSSKNINFHEIQYLLCHFHSSWIFPESYRILPTSDDDILFVLQNWKDNKRDACWVYCCVFTTSVCNQLENHALSLFPIQGGIAGWPLSIPFRFSFIISWENSLQELIWENKAWLVAFSVFVQSNFASTRGQRHSKSWYVTAHIPTPPNFLDVAILVLASGITWWDWPKKEVKLMLQDLLDPRDDGNKSLKLTKIKNFGTYLAGLKNQNW